MLQQGSPAAITCPPTAPTLFKSLRRTIIWTCGLVFGFIVLAVGFYFISVNWPYRYREIHPLLEDVFASQVKITRYHRTYFPSPGFVATGIILRRKSAPDLPPLGTVETLFVQGRWSDLLISAKECNLWISRGCISSSLPSVAAPCERIFRPAAARILGDRTP